jgi:predicted PurR-regulated permease PerM
MTVSLSVVLTFFLEAAFDLKVVAVLVLLAGIHLGLQRLLERRLMGREHDISPLLVLFSVFFWAWLWGIPGMILAVPILTAARIVFENVPSLRFLGTMIDK